MILMVFWVDVGGRPERILWALGYPIGRWVDPVRKVFILWYRRDMTFISHSCLGIAWRNLADIPSLSQHISGHLGISREISEIFRDISGHLGNVLGISMDVSGYLGHISGISRGYLGLSRGHLGISRDIFGHLGISRAYLRDISRKFGSISG